MMMGGGGGEEDLESICDHIKANGSLSFPTSKKTKVPSHVYVHR